MTANNVSQTSGVITAAALNLSGGSFTLGDANQIGAVSGSVGTFALTDGSSLSVAGGGLAATGDVSLNTSGDLTLNGAVSGADVSLAAATGNVLVNAAINANTLGVTANSVLIDAGRQRQYSGGDRQQCVPDVGSDHGGDAGLERRELHTGRRQPDRRGVRLGGHDRADRWQLAERWWQRPHRHG